MIEKVMNIILEHKFDVHGSLMMCDDVPPTDRRVKSASRSVRIGKIFIFFRRRNSPIPMPCSFPVMEVPKN